MGLSASIARLEQRIRAVSRRDAGLGASLGLDLQVIRGYLGSPTAERIATLMFALLARLEQLERPAALVTPSQPRKQRHLTREEALAAVSEHGSARAAARALGVSHPTVLKAVNLPLPTSNTSAGAP